MRFCDYKTWHKYFNRGIILTIKIFQEFIILKKAI